MAAGLEGGATRQERSLWAQALWSPASVLAGNELILQGSVFWRPRKWTRHEKSSLFLKNWALLDRTAPTRHAEVIDRTMVDNSAASSDKHAEVTLC